MSDNYSLSERVAEEIRALIARRRKSGRQLAAELGVSQTWMSTRLNGATPIDLNDLEKIATILNVEVSDLLPRNTEGRVVVSAGTTRRQTTGPYSPVARTAYPNGQAHRPAPSPASRRLARVAQVRS